MMSGILLAALAAQSTPDSMPANSWLEVPNTKMRAVDPCPARTCSYSAVEGQSAVIDDWNGAALDTTRSRLICWGGGHYGYYGNELYAFDVPTLRWLRLTNPTDPPTAGSDTNWDGTPQSRHSYNGVAYIAHADRFFAFGGSGCTIGNSGFPPTTNVWTFNFGTLPYGPGNWRNQQAGGFRPHAGEGSNAAYDPVTRKVWFGEGWNSNPSTRWGLFSYDIDANTWTQHTNESVFSASTSCIDTKRGLLVVVGRGRMDVYNIRSGTPTRQSWATTGGAAIIGASAPGIDYDPVADRIVGWSSGPVYVLDPDTKVWTVNNPAGAPAPGLNGTYRRWSYVPSVNAFVLVTHVDRNVFFYKLMAGGGGSQPPPSPDTTAPAVAITSPASTAATATPVSLGGTASDAVGVTQVTWSNAATGGTGTATGTTSWTASVPLASGANAIMVTARDAAGNAGTATITVTYTPPGGDTTPPGVTIGSPMSGPAASDPAVISGTASDNAGINTITWSNALTGGSGTVTGTTNWTVSVPLGVGTNVITITVYDPSGNTATATVSLDWTGGGGGGAVTGDGEGTEGFCGLLGAEALGLALLGLLRRRVSVRGGAAPGRTPTSADISDPAAGR